MFINAFCIICMTSKLIQKKKKKLSKKKKTKKNTKLKAKEKKKKERIKKKISKIQFILGIRNRTGSDESIFQNGYDLQLKKDKEHILTGVQRFLEKLHMK